MDQIGSFCNKCGTALISESTHSYLANSSPAAQPAQTAGNALSLAAMICGGISLLFFPIILGPVGIVLSAVAKSKGEKNAIIALSVAIGGMIIGLWLGAIAFGL
jgi:hypothetical protein